MNCFRGIEDRNSEYFVWCRLQEHILTISSSHEYYWFRNSQKANKFYLGETYWRSGLLIYYDLFSSCVEEIDEKLVQPVKKPSKSTKGTSKSASHTHQTTTPASSSRLEAIQAAFTRRITKYLKEELPNEQSKRAQGIQNAKLTIENSTRAQYGEVFEIDTRNEILCKPFEDTKCIWKCCQVSNSTL